MNISVTKILTTVAIILILSALIQITVTVLIESRAKSFSYNTALLFKTAKNFSISKRQSHNIKIDIVNGKIEFKEGNNIIESLLVPKGIVIEKVTIKRSEGEEKIDLTKEAIITFSTIGLLNKYDEQYCNFYIFIKRKRSPTTEYIIFVNAKNGEAKVLDGETQL